MPKSVTRTLRLNEGLDAAIQRKANDANTSVNFLVNKLIRKYIEWDLPGEKFGLGPVAASLLNSLLDEVGDQTAYDVGRKFAHEFFKPFATYLFGQLDLATSIMLFRRASEYGGRYTFDTNSDDRHRILVLRHGGGLRVSRFYSGMFQGLYSEILKLQVKVETTKDYCMVQIPSDALN